MRSTSGDNFCRLSSLGVMEKHDAAHDTRGRHPENGLGLHYSRFSPISADRLLFPQLLARSKIGTPAATQPSQASEGVYWVRESPRRSRARWWTGVGRAIKVKGCSGAMAVTRVFRVRVARSARRVRKLWTGRPSSVRPVVCLVTAAGERRALATMLERCASAASLSLSS